MRPLPLLVIAAALAGCDRVPPTSDDTDAGDDTEAGDTQPDDGDTDGDTEDPVVDTDDAPPDTDAWTGPGLLTTIPDIRDGTGGILLEDLVAVRGVVVTAVQTRGFVIQDPTADRFAGIYVFAGEAAAKPAVGDVVDVVGEYGEYAGSTPADSTVDSQGQIALASANPDHRWTKTGSGGTVEPVLVTLANFVSTADSEPFESMVVTLVGPGRLEVTSDPAQNFGEFDVTADGSTVEARIDQELYSLRTQLQGIAPGASFESVSGVVWFSFGEHKVAPRAATDAVGFEPSAGDTDVDTDPAGPATVADLRNGTATAGSTYTLEGLVVTHVDEVSAGLRAFTAQDPALTEYGGLYVYLGSKTAPAVGDVVTVIGIYEEFNGTSSAGPRATSLTQLDAGGPTVGFGATTTGTAPLPAPIAVTVSGFAAVAERYESMLVTVSGSGGLEVRTDPGASGAFGEFDVGTAGTSDVVRVDQEFVSARTQIPTLGVGDTFTSVTGPIFFSFSKHKVAPRTRADLAGYVDVP